MAHSVAGQWRLWVQKTKLEGLPAPSKDGGPSAFLVERPPKRGDRATPECERICKSRISPKSRTIRYTKAVRQRCAFQPGERAFQAGAVMP